MKRGLRIVPVLLALVASTAVVARAELIRIGLSAEVSYIQQPETENLLDGQLEIGDVIVGTYVYNSDTQDDNPLTDVGGRRLLALHVALRDFLVGGRIYI